MIENNKIVIVDDEEELRELVADVLEADNFKVIKCADTDEGYKRF
jgi:DNA-binding response OmpR family regulator